MTPIRAFPPLQSAMKSSDLNLQSIVNTHHHWDHSGGNSKMLEQLKQKIPIKGGKDCQVVTETPKDRSTFDLGKNIKVTALYTPCHTQDSICWFAEDKAKNQRAVFTGDTLFIGGCGRFFEGTPEQMNTSLNETLASLPDDTKVYPGHEYTKANVKFLAKVAPQDKEVLRLQEHADKEAETPGKSTIGDEKKWNLFMRVHDDTVRKITGENDDVSAMKKLREMKNAG